MRRFQFINFVFPSSSVFFVRHLSRKSVTGKSERNLLPKNYFIGGKSPSVGIPKKPVTLVANSSPINYSTGGIIKEWRENVLSELEQHVGELPHPGSVAERKFKCSTCDKIWSAKIRDRNDVQQDIGCPHCLKGDQKSQLVLEIAAPQIAQEWDLARNKLYSSLTPATASVKSEAKIWWICSLCTSSFVSSIKDRVEGHANCPTCIEAKLDPTLKFNVERKKRLQREEQELKAQLKKKQDDSVEDTIRNPLNKIESVKAETALPSWTCSKCGISWRGSSFQQRLALGTVCPSCSGDVITSGNSLLRNRPDVVGSFTLREKQLRLAEIEKLTITSPDIFWFQCWTCRKEYRMSVRERCRFKGKGENQNQSNPCPHCARARRQIALDNDQRVRNAIVAGNTSTAAIGLEGYVNPKTVNLKINQKTIPVNFQHITTKRNNGEN
jgi:Zn finger protein HypA/HybF involved in hydrogenase expression